MGANPGRRTGSIICFAVAVLAAALTACFRQEVVRGECRPLNGADVCVWGETSGSSLVAFGVTVPVTTVENAPADAPMVWPPAAGAVMQLPPAVTSATGFKVLFLYWEPVGHPPGPYLTPHFDFHFYTLSADEVSAIDCADSTKPRRLPSGYELPDLHIPELGTLHGMCLPKMGMHAMAGRQLRAMSTFDNTIIVGYYHGQPAYLEPMITRATLLERSSFTIDVPEVPDLPEKVRYPTQFRAEYDRGAQAYKLIFSNLTIPPRQ